jgi:8-oxo-dGTP pyrophosphatase MutT (NUDIX family)
MSLPPASGHARPEGSEEWVGPVADSGDPLPVVNREVRFEGYVWSVVSEDVAFDGVTARRDVIVHPGAVAVIALDDDDRVLLIRQYRHPVGRWLFEPPAGLLDAAGEPPWRTAQRELAEESGYQARHWDVLVDLYTSPGGMSEAIRVYLARGLSPLPDGRPHTGEAEEAHLPRAWVPLDDARDLVLSGDLGSPTSVSGILAAWTGRAAGWSTLRPADAPWPARDQLLATDRVRLPRRNGA